jgi:hypothetical protein
MEKTPSQRRVRREQRSAKQRAKAIALRRAGATYTAIGAELGVCVERARTIVLKAQRLIECPRWSDALPTRATTFLDLRGLSELPEAEAALAVAKFTRKEIKDEPNLGKGAIGAIKAWLAGHGLTLRDEITVETNKKGAPVQGRPHDSRNPSQAGRKASSQCDMPRNAP